MKNTAKKVPGRSSKRSKIPATIAKTGATKTGKAAKITAKAKTRGTEIIANASPFGQLIRKTRIAKKMSATEVAEKIGFSAQSVINWESRPNVNIKPANVSPLAKALGIPVRKLEKIVETSRRA